MSINRREQERKRFLAENKKIAKSDSKKLSVSEIENLIRESERLSVAFAQAKYVIENLVFEVIERNYKNLQILDEYRKIIKLKNLHEETYEEYSSLMREIWILDKSVKKYFSKKNMQNLKYKSECLNDKKNDIESKIKSYSDLFGKKIIEDINKYEKILAIAEIVKSQIGGFKFFIPLESASGFMGIFLNYIDNEKEFTTQLFQEINRRNFESYFIDEKNEYRYGKSSKWYRLALEKELPEARKRDRLRGLQAASSQQNDEQRKLARSERNVGRYQRQRKAFRGCPYCGQPFSSDELTSEVHLDHIYPVSRGGRSLVQNLVFICADCNAKKSDQTLAVFCSKAGLDLIDITERLLKLGKAV